MTPPAAELPNVLVLSHEIPQTVYAGCILLHRLFRHYPPERLLVLGQPPDPRADRLGCRYETLTTPLVRLHRTRFASLKRSLDALGLLPTVSPRAVRRRLGGFAPDVVVSVFEERHPFVAARYARTAGVPLVLIVHDKPELFDVVKPWARGRQVRANAALYRSAAARLNVSPEMRDHLRDLYGTDGEVMYPNRTEDLTARPPEIAADLRNPPRLTVGYAGSLTYGYGDQLRRLAGALRGSQVRLNVYGTVPADDPLATDLADVVACRGLVATPELLWQQVKSECDAVVLPYAWGSADAPVELYRTHFPSKLPEYLALGLPVVIMGPGFATGVRWGLRNPKAAVTLVDDDPARWVSALEALRQDDGRRVDLAVAAGVAGGRDFDPVRIRDEFVARLVDLAAKRPGRPAPPV